MSIYHWREGAINPSRSKATIFGISKWWSIIGHSTSELAAGSAIPQMRSISPEKLPDLLQAAKHEIQKSSACCTTSFGSTFKVFHLAGSTCHATKTFIAGWRNAAHWLVDLLGMDPRWQHFLRDKLWVWWKTSNKIALYFSQQLVARQVEGLCMSYFAAFMPKLVIHVQQGQFDQIQLFFREN